ncbi:MAG: hypothetical protein PHG85_07390 [Candidatus Altiarchaeota archaeon]|nr:hypothetical protein [Candidatus Altiarchaeota archaeon]
MEQCQQTTVKPAANATDLDALMQMQYVFENFGFIPNWINVKAY